MTKEQEEFVAEVWSVVNATQGVDRFAMAGILFGIAASLILNGDVRTCVE